MKHLLRMYPDQFLDESDVVIKILLEKINKAGDDIVELAVEVLATISQYENYFTKVISKMLDMFFHKRELIKSKSTVIIRKLSMSLDPEKLFVTFATSLLKF